MDVHTVIKRLLALTCLVLLTTSVWAEKPSRIDPDALLWMSAPKAKISLLDAIRLASKEVSGIPVRAFLMRYEHQLVYKVVLVDNTSRTWTALRVDAIRGKVSGIKTYRLSHRPKTKKP